MFKYIPLLFFFLAPTKVWLRFCLGLLWFQSEDNQEIQLIQKIFHSHKELCQLRVSQEGFCLSTSNFFFQSFGHFMQFVETLELL